MRLPFRESHTKLPQKSKRLWLEKRQIVNGLFGKGRQASQWQQSCMGQQRQILLLPIGRPHWRGKRDERVPWVHLR